MSAERESVTCLGWVRVKANFRIGVRFSYIIPKIVKCILPVCSRDGASGLTDTEIHTQKRAKTRCCILYLNPKS